MRLSILILLVLCCYGPTVSAQVPFCVNGTYPTNGSTGINIYQPIAWSSAFIATSYDVVFGTTNPPTTVVANTTSTTYYPTSPYTYSTTYYWYVVPKNASGAATGCTTRVSSFTAQDPALPCSNNLLPVNGAQNVTVTPHTVFKWTTVAGAASYEVTYGIDSPYYYPHVPRAIVSAPDTTLNLPTLMYNTKYRWRATPYKAGLPSTSCDPAGITRFTTTAPLPNCTYQYDHGCVFGTTQILRFWLKGENGRLGINTERGCNNGIPYLDTTDHPLVIDLAAGKSYSGGIAATGSEATVWLDANDDGIFDNAERLLNNVPTSYDIGINIAPRPFNLYIPPTTPLGNHRLRVRTVGGPTYTSEIHIDACARYQAGETEDYKVNIVATGAPYTIAAYTTGGSCYTNTNITIDPPSNNTNSTIPIVDTNNAIIAMLSPNGNNLGLVTISYYRHNGAVRQDPQGIYYLGRNINLKSQRQPTAPWGLRFYYQAAELNDLIAQPGSGVSAQANLKMTKNGDACRTAVNLPGTLHTPTSMGSAGADGYLDFAGLTGPLSSFYLHGGSTPIPLTLLNFTAQKTSDDKYLLQWSTAQEVNTAFFTAEYSTDGRHFTSAGQLPAAGNSSVTQYYQFTGSRLLAGVNYFRLKTTDMDGRVHYSKIVTLLHNQNGFEVIGIAPNPVTQASCKLSIAANRSINIEIVITDMTGRMVAKQRNNIQSGLNAIEVNVGQLAKGSYQLTGVTAAGKTRAVKFVVQ